MQRVSATVVAVVGEDEAKRAALRALRAATAGAPFVVQDADPLGDVATAWVRARHRTTWLLVWRSAT